MRNGKVISLLTLATLLAACQSDQKKQEQARQGVRSWTAGIALTCANWRRGALPQQFLQRSIREARQKLQKEIAPLPQAEQQSALQAAHDSTCAEARGS